MAESLPDTTITDPQLRLVNPFSSATARPSSKDGSSSELTKSLEAHQAQGNPENDISSASDNKPKPQSLLDVKKTCDTQSNSQLSALQATNDRPQSQPSIDPLSQHIVERTSSNHQHKSSKSDGSVTTNLNRALGVSEVLKNATEPAGAEVNGTVIVKDKRKSVSFLSRLTGKKKRDFAEPPLLQSEDMIDDRPEGADAQVFSESFDYMSFSPRHPHPPAYIKVRSRYKKDREFNRIFLAQELRPVPSTPTNLKRQSTTSTIRSKSENTAEGNGIWALEFSLDGKYLASTGQDKIVRVWQVLSSQEERRKHERAEEENSNGHAKHVHLSAPVFRSTPYREYEGHTAPVLDLSWSKNHFLLSSSMDKTVRLWHASRSECLCAFKHSDFVTSIQFHPKDDRFFLAGSLDSKLRLWSIPDKSVAFWSQLPEMITAVAFTPDGKTAIAGCLTGLCQFYETEGLRYQSQIHVKSAHGKNAKGSKITGIKTAVDKNNEVKLMVTSNDSRIRLYNLRDKSLEMKFKGNENTTSQIHARFGDDMRYIICGSEDKKVYIWSTTPSETDKKYKFPLDMFEAHSAATTVSVLAPLRTRKLLSASEDPIYDLCNPPPITLRSRSEVESNHSASNKSPTEYLHQPHGAPRATLNGDSSIQTTPATAEHPSSTSPHFPRSVESPAYLAKTGHPNGNIIITADAMGAIKVFRQDCAWQKRGDPTTSFSRRVSVNVRRTGSLATRKSSISRQNSDASSTQPGRDRILSWRQSITASNSSLDKTAIGISPPATLSPSSQSFFPPSKPTAGSSSAHSLPLRTQNRSESPRIRTPSLFTRTPRFSRQDSAVSTNSSPIHPPSASETDHESTRKSSLDTPSATASVSNGAPTLSRANSSQYWSKQAWKDEIVEQLKASRGRFRDDSATRNGTAAGSSGQFLAAPRAGHRGVSPHSGASSSNVSTLDMPPLEVKMSGASALSMNVPSDVESLGEREGRVARREVNGVR